MLQLSVFISYSKDNDSRNDLVLNVAQKLREIGVDVILDRYELKLGNDLLYFMEQSVSSADKMCISVLL